MSVPLLDSGVAKYTLPGEGESGDLHLIRATQQGVLIAAIDGIGHGEDAASAAREAVSILEKHADEPIISLVKRCHEELRPTRGVVMSLAFVDTLNRMMTWLGVGNVQGVLMRAGATNGIAHEQLLLRAGVVGAQLPALQAAVLPIAPGDTLIFATDGVRGEFVESLLGLEGPQRAADRILELHRTAKDDALVLVARLTGIRP